MPGGSLLRVWSGQTWCEPKACLTGQAVAEVEALDGLCGSSLAEIINRREDGYLWTVTDEVQITECGPPDMPELGTLLPETDQGMGAIGLLQNGERVLTVRVESKKHRC